MLGVCVALIAASASAQTPVGIFDAQTDVGRTQHPGSTSYDPHLQQYVIAGSGQNMWSQRDDFHFVWKRMTGNFILSTRARFIGKGVEEIRVSDSSGAYRVIYLARRAEAVYVLHAFHKKAQATPRKDLEIAKGRFRQLLGGRI